MSSRLLGVRPVGLTAMTRSPRLSGRSATSLSVTRAQQSKTELRSTGLSRKQARRLGMI